MISILTHATIDAVTLGPNSRASGARSAGGSFQDEALVAGDRAIGSEGHLRRAGADLRGDAAVRDLRQRFAFHSCHKITFPLNPFDENVIFFFLPLHVTFRPSQRDNGKQLRTLLPLS